MDVIVAVQLPTGSKKPKVGGIGFEGAYAQLWVRYLLRAANDGDDTNDSQQPRVTKKTTLFIGTTEKLYITFVKRIIEQNIGTKPT